MSNRLLGVARRIHGALGDSNPAYTALREQALVHTVGGGMRFIAAAIAGVGRRPEF